MLTPWMGIVEELEQKEYSGRIGAERVKVEELGQNGYGWKNWNRKSIVEELEQKEYSGRIGTERV